jgi:uncharacterized RDD family membrane protein YckC
MVCETCKKEILPDSVFCVWCSDFVPSAGTGRKANLFARWLALVLDPLIAVVLYFLGVGVIGLISKNLGLAAAVILPFVYLVWFLGLLRQGLTPGKKMLGLQVVDYQTGKIPGFGKMFLREIVGRFVSGLFLGLGYFWAIFDKNSQAWHDKIAGTVVLKRTPGTAPALAPVPGQTELASPAPPVAVAVAEAVPEAPRRRIIERWWPAAAGTAVLALALVVVVVKRDAKSDKPATVPLSKVDGPLQQGSTPSSPPLRVARPANNAGLRSNQPSTRTQPVARPPLASAASGKADLVRPIAAPTGKADLVRPMAAPTAKADSIKSVPAAPAEPIAPPAAPAAHVVVPDACAGKTRCFNAGHFTAALSYVAVSQVPYSGSIQRNVKLTIKLQNLTDQPIILAYRSRSGQLIDDRGNRYANAAGSEASFVKGIGISSGTDANPEFSLDPREAREVILDNTIGLANSIIFGVTYTYDFTIDELVVQNSRAHSARSVAISFRDITEPSHGGDDSEAASERGGETMTSGEGETGGPSVSERVASFASQDPCNATSNCYNAGRFTATVTRLWSRQIKYTGTTAFYAKLTVRIRNISDKPITLTYKMASAQLIDDAGHRYVSNWIDGTGGRHVNGIGVSDNATNPPLVLGPGEARDATFDNQISLNGNDAPGTVNSYDLELQEVELMPSGQTRVTRTDAVAFHDLKESVRSNAGQPDTTSYDAGRFVAGIVHVSSGDTPYSGRVADRLVTVTMSIKNVTDQPMILAYRSRSQQLSDDREHGFTYAERAGDVTGIGLNTGNMIDAVFTLAPGESREASFKNVVRLFNDDVPGSRYDYDLVLDECERLPSKQLRVLHTYSVSFHDFQDTPRSKRQMILDALKPVIKRPPT